MNISFLKNAEKYVDIVKIRKGWSLDKKYILTDKDYHKYLLRISDLSTYEKKQKDYIYLKKLAKYNLNISIPLELGKTNDFTYILFNYIEGNDLEDIIETLPKTKQYDLGLQAGKTLKQIHKIKINENINFEEFFKNKINNKIEKYLNCNYKNENVDLCINHVLKNLHLLKDRKIVLLHGDYHINNMIIKDNTLSIIDFNKLDYGDPYLEFNRLAFSSIISKDFTKGMINGYFNDRIPKKFYSYLSFYMAYNAISNIPWALENDPKSLPFLEKCVEETIKLFDFFKTNTPNFL